MPYLHLLPLVINEQYGEGEMSQAVVFVYFISFFFHLLFLLWKSVDHNQPLLHLSIPCLFPLTLILCSLLYFLNSCYSRLESPIGYINSGPTHCIVTFLTMTINKDSGISKTKTSFHGISNEIYFIRRRYKVRSTTSFLLHYFPCTSPRSLKN